MAVGDVSTNQFQLFLAFEKPFLLLSNASRMRHALHSYVIICLCHVLSTFCHVIDLGLHSGDEIGSEVVEVFTVICLGHAAMFVLI